MKNSYARKQRQLSHASKVLSKIYKSDIKSKTDKIEKLKTKIHFLISELSRVISTQRIKKLIGGAALILGIAFTNPLSAQVKFAEPDSLVLGLKLTEDEFVFDLGDLDGDGDYDILVSSYNEEWVYFENIGDENKAMFGTPVIDPFNLTGFFDGAIPSLVDLDGDGDLDLFVTEYYAQVSYFENIGTATNPNFASPVKDPFGKMFGITENYNAIANFADMDNDGDLDILAGLIRYEEGVYKYFENTGDATNPQFSAVSVDVPGLLNVNYFAFGKTVDIDLDGDFDLFSVNYSYDDGLFFEFFENSGTAEAPFFEPLVKDPYDLDLTDKYLSVLSFADMDSDGDIDMLSMELDYDDEGRTTYYYENVAIDSRIEIIDHDFELYPNPVSNKIEIDTDVNWSQISIVDAIGLTHYSSNSVRSIDVSHLTSGAYFLVATDNLGNTINRKFIKK